MIVKIVILASLWLTDLLLTTSLMLKCGGEIEFNYVAFCVFHYFGVWGLAGLKLLTFITFVVPFVLIKNKTIHVFLFLLFCGASLFAIVLGIQSHLTYLHYVG